MTALEPTTPKGLVAQLLHWVWDLPLYLDNTPQPIHFSPNLHPTHNWRKLSKTSAEASEKYFKLIFLEENEILKIFHYSFPSACLVSIHHLKMLVPKYVMRKTGLKETFLIHQQSMDYFQLWFKKKKTQNFSQQYYLNEMTIKSESKVTKWWYQDIEVNILNVIW